MICPNCGARVTNSRYCDKCGAAMPARASRGAQGANGRASRGAQGANGRARTSRQAGAGYQPARAQRSAQRGSRGGSQYQRSQRQRSQYQPYGLEQASSSNTALKVVIVIAAIALVAVIAFFFVLPKFTASTDQGAVAEGSASAQAASTFDARYYDSFYNPTLYAVTELTGTELGKALERVNFEWASAGDAWFASDGSMVCAEGAGGSYTSGDFGILAAGAAGTPVKFVVVAAGYSSPDDAVDGLSKDVAVDERSSDGKRAYALVTNSAGNQYLVIASKSGDDGQMLEVYNEQAITNGLLEEVVTEDATIQDAWRTVTV